MKIAQVSHPGVRVPPIKYGGAELVIANLINGLVNRGHQVTLFGTKDSATKAQRVISFTDKPLGLGIESVTSVDNRMVAALTLFRAYQLADQFDIVHWHVSHDLWPVMLASIIPQKSVVTFHNFFTSDKLDDFFKLFKDVTCNISISESFRRKIPLKFQAVVHNGINIRELSFSPKGGNYISWLGRFSPVKGTHFVIKVAQRLKKVVKLAAPPPQVPKQEMYFKKEIRPHLRSKNVQYIGEVDTNQKSNLLQSSRVFLNPIQWDEAFGLVVPEANACGTPVIAYARGSMPELIKDGVNGFLVKPNDLEGMIKLTEKIYQMPEDKYRAMRRACRQHVEENFTVEKMVDGYERVYEKVIADFKSKNPKS
jgi:glycosyltransferase involved in cell wall biosynthesis